MRKDLKLLLIIGLLLPGSVLAQADEDIFEANRLKKVFPDDRVAATTVEEEYTFDKGRSDDKLPVVTCHQEKPVSLSWPCGKGPASSILISIILSARSLPSNN
jgi:hypothetical protein